MEESIFFVMEAADVFHVSIFLSALIVSSC